LKGRARCGCCRRRIATVLGLRRLLGFLKAGARQQFVEPLATFLITGTTLTKVAADRAVAVVIIPERGDLSLKEKESAAPRSEDEGAAERFRRRHCVQ
jgi:hypothetical protein